VEQGFSPPFPQFWLLASSSSLGLGPVLHPFLVSLNRFDFRLGFGFRGHAFLKLWPCLISFPFLPGFLFFFFFFYPLLFIGPFLTPPPPLVRLSRPPPSLDIFLAAFPRRSSGSKVGWNPPVHFSFSLRGLQPLTTPLLWFPQVLLQQFCSNNCKFNRNFELFFPSFFLLCPPPANPFPFWAPPHNPLQPNISIKKTTWCPRAHPTPFPLGVFQGGRKDFRVFFVCSWGRVGGGLFSFLWLLVPFLSLLLLAFDSFRGATAFVSWWPFFSTWFCLFLHTALCAFWLCFFFPVMVLPGSGFSPHAASFLCPPPTWALFLRPQIGRYFFRFLPTFFFFFYGVSPDGQRLSRALGEDRVWYQAFWTRAPWFHSTRPRKRVPPLAEVWGPWGNFPLRCSF